MLQEQYWYWLSKVEEVGGAARTRLLQAFGSPEYIVQMKVN